MPTYGSDVFTGGTASADTLEGAQTAAMGFDDINTDAKGWLSTNTAFPHWIKYDLGAGNEVNLAKVRISPFADASGAMVKNFTVQGSNNDSSYTVLYTGLATNTTTSAVFQDFTFTANGTDFRYIKFNFTDSWNTTNQTYVDEIEGMEDLSASSAPFIPQSRLTLLGVS